ncbi:hypothetical protein [Halovivax gelatinilyticus]|uniref:hypothetical protein n=1 Tax=Halovivax gelatinilyticus TaxID=2961597 RepID=UPI0020CA975F|nr:hypothetical protein [Halovivax gelatinilyticus]
MREIPRRTTILAGPVALLVPGCVAVPRKAPTEPTIRAVIISNETDEGESISVRVEADGSIVHEETYSIAAGADRIVEEPWMDDPADYVVSATVENTAGSEVVSGGPIHGEYEKGACLTVRIRRDGVTLHQRLAGGPCR